MNKNKFSGLIFLFSVFSFVILSWDTIYCQNVTVEAKADSVKFLIGDQFTLTLRVSSDERTNIIFPEIGSLIPNFEIINTGGTDTLSDGGKYILERKYVLTCFDSGSYSIPSLTFMYEKKGMAGLYPAKTNPLSLYFGIPALGKDIIDIKKPLDEPVTFSEYLPYIIIFAAILILGGLIYFYFRRKKPAAPEQAPERLEPRIPAHILALAALDKLKSENLWQKGELKEHYTRLTEILRTYIERKYKILALEMASAEIIEFFEKNTIDKETLEKLVYILDNADMTKFAKQKPDNTINTKTLDDTYYFINKTSIDSNNTEKSN